MGIDVWAQNTTKSTHPRVTYPKQHGGGTYTGIAVSELGEFGLSAAVFAPAWTFEHFPGHEHVAERALWDGEIIPEDMECACGKALEIHPRGKALAAFARQFAAGSQQYFYTDFARAFGCHRDGLSKWLYDGKRMHSQLAAQSILPYMALTSGFDVVDRLDNAVNILCMVLDDSPGHTYLLVQVGSVIPPGENAEQFYERLLPLFRVDMTPVGPLRFKVGYKGMISLPETTATFYLKFTTGIAFISLIEGDGLREIEGPVLHGEISSSTRLIEVGVYLKSRPIEERLTVVEITGIHIGPLVKMQGTCKIENIRTELRSNGDEQHWRLCWDIFDKNEEAIISAGQPYSLITGPFSYFTINIDGISARSYALEWVVFQSMVELMAGRVVEASITGIGFGGQRLAYAASAVRIS